MSVLHVFDMDGTLLKGSACLEISRAIGAFDETHDIEEAWTRGDISDTDFWDRCLPLWTELSDAHIECAFAQTHWMEGVQAVFSDIQSRCEKSVVITQSPMFFADRLRRWGVDFAFGSRVLPSNPEVAVEMISSADKLRITHELLGQLGLSPHECVAYGDSNSDLALFEFLDLTVAVNAQAAIRRLARVAYDGPDLWQAYLVGRKLLEQRISV